jgi:hypothetical protein
MRGYQKRVIYLKNMGSRNFEEAYFVIRADVGEKKDSSHLMIEEANRIINENFEKKSSRLYKYGWHALTFIAGALVSLLVMFLIEIIFGIF